MKLTTSWASAPSKVPSANGSASAAASSMRAPGTRSRQAAANVSDGSTAATLPGAHQDRELGRERAGPAADVEHPPLGADARRVDQRPRQLAAVAADEPVIRVRRRAEHRRSRGLGHGPSLPRRGPPVKMRALFCLRSPAAYIPPTRAAARGRRPDQEGFHAHARIHRPARASLPSRSWRSPARRSRPRQRRRPTRAATASGSRSSASRRAPRPPRCARPPRTPAPRS